MVELHQTGIDRLLTLVNLEPSNEKAYFNLGMITMDEVLGASEITANLYCKCVYLYWEGCLICSIYLR